MTYGKAGGGGLATFEFFRQRPELAMYDEVGRPGFENYDAALLDYLQAIGGPKPGETRGQVGKPEEMEKLGYEGAGAAWFKPYFKQLIWNAIWYDGNDDRVIQHHGEELCNLVAQEQLVPSTARLRQLNSTTSAIFNFCTVKQEN